MFCSMICLLFILFAFFSVRNDNEIDVDLISISLSFHWEFCSFYEISILRFDHIFIIDIIAAVLFFDVLSFACKFFSFVFNYLSYRKLILCFMQLNYYYYYIWIDSDKKEEFLSFFNVTIYIVNTLIILKLNLWLRRCRSYRHFHFRDI